MEYINFSILLVLVFMAFRLEKRGKLLEKWFEEDENNTGGVYPAFSKREISGVILSANTHYQALEKYGGIMISSQDIESHVSECLRKGESLEKARGMARKYLVHAGLYQLISRNHEYMKQANVDVLNGKRTIKEVQSELSTNSSPTFQFAGLDFEFEKRVEKFEKQIEDFYLAKKAVN